MKIGENNISQVSDAIKVCFSDFHPKSSNKLSHFLSRYFTFEIDNDNPDYVIYAVFGNQYLKYKNSIRIFYTGENLRPDFNLCDYAFSFDWLEFGDRHFRAPNYILYDEWSDILQRKRTTFTRSSLNGKRFCNFIYSHGNGDPIRDELFHALNKERKVDALGRHFRNTFEEIGRAYRGDWAATKVSIQSQYKFSIAIENTSNPGYTTEKLIHALAADTIPIYWGDPLVGNTFNLNRIINLNELSISEAVRRIIEIEEDDNLFLEIVNQPFFANDAIPLNLTTEALVEAFNKIFSQPKEKAFRRNFHFWSKNYEEIRVGQIEAYNIYEKAKWGSRVLDAIEDIKAFIPPNTKFLLIDDNQLQESEFELGRVCKSFMEKNGEYFGVPTNDDEAIAELEIHLMEGVSFFVLAWPSFWWVDFYKAFFQNLRSRFSCVVQSDRILIFDLRASPNFT